jgi:pimeloyl-ACP methyl ester carboxylesterase
VDTLDSAPAKIIVLVHGTFARNAAWTRSDSVLRRGIIEKIPGEKSISAFSWSGWNSSTARFNATERLRAELKRRAAKYPDWDIVVIGHSHGGAVAMRAVDCDELRERVSVVCLSTPFLQAFPRNLPTGVFTQLGAGISCVVAAAIHPGLPFSHLLHVPQLIYPNYLHFLANRINASIFIGIVAGVLSLVLWLLSALRKQADQVAKEVMYVPSLPTSNVLLLRVAGDEASSWISVFQVLSWISSKAARLYTAGLLVVKDRFVSLLTSLVIALTPLAKILERLWHMIFDDRPVYLNLKQSVKTSKEHRLRDEDPCAFNERMSVIILVAFACIYACILYAFSFSSASVLMDVLSSWHLWLRRICARTHLAGVPRRRRSEPCRIAIFSRTAAAGTD